MDASYNLNACPCTIGEVARNSEAEVSFLVVARFEGVQSSLQAELYTILTGLEVARMRNLNGIQLDSDCHVTVREILKKKESFCEWGSVITDIQELALEFESCIISHVKRKANHLAHNLAKYPCDLGEYRLWWEALPPSVCNPDVI